MRLKYSLLRMSSEMLFRHSKINMFKPELIFVQFFCCGASIDVESAVKERNNNVENTGKRVGN